MIIGILCIATNRYSVFVQPLVESIRQYFLLNHDKTIFLFTDAPYEHAKLGEGIVIIRHEHEPWPNPTLKRFHTFTKHRALLETQDYLVYCDVDMLFVDYVDDRVLPNHGLSVVLHPGFYRKARHCFSYETRPESQAFVAPNQGIGYFAGGFNLGVTSVYLAYAEKCKAMIDIDLANGIVPIHHDESISNRYCIDNKPEKILSPGFCFPEHLVGTNGKSADYNLDGVTPKLLALEKCHQKLRF